MYKKIRDTYVVGVRSPPPSSITSDVETPWDSSLHHLSSSSKATGCGGGIASSDAIIMPPPEVTSSTATATRLPPHKSKDPQVWGPALWLALHTCAAYYPEKAHALCQMQAKGFIMGLPSMLPCESCSAHAQAFIDAHQSQMDYIVSGKKPIFAFFVDFHNAVNRRQHKKVLSIEEALTMYSL